MALVKESSASLDISGYFYIATSPHLKRNRYVKVGCAVDLIKYLWNYNHGLLREKHTRFVFVKKIQSNVHQFESTMKSRMKTFHIGGEIFNCRVSQILHIFKQEYGRHKKLMKNKSLKNI